MDATWLPGIVAVGALAFIWWDIRRSRTMNEVKIKKALYREDGITIFMPRGECKDAHDLYCKKTEEIKKLVADMDAKRDIARKTDASKWEAVNRTLGRIEGKMETNS